MHETSKHDKKYNKISHNIVELTAQPWKYPANNHPKDQLGKYGRLMRKKAFLTTYFNFLPKCVNFNDRILAKSLYTTILRSIYFSKDVEKIFGMADLQWVLMWILVGGVAARRFLVWHVFADLLKLWSSADPLDAECPNKGCLYLNKENDIV